MWGPVKDTELPLDHNKTKEEDACGILLGNGSQMILDNVRVERFWSEGLDKRKHRLLPQSVCKT